MWGSGMGLRPNFDSLYGLEVSFVDTPGLVRGDVLVTDSVRDSSGDVHPGILAAMAVSLASFGTSYAMSDSGRIGVAVSVDMYVCEPISTASFVGEGTVRFRGVEEWIWDVDIADDTGRLCAMGRVTVAVQQDEEFSPTAK